MANVVILLFLLLVCIWAVRSYWGKLRHGCCGADSAPEARIKVRDREPSHYPYQAELRIEGMTCGQCRTRVENAFNAEDGLWAQVDLRRGTALVRAKRPLEERELCLLTGRAGYHVTAIDGQPPKTVL